MINVVKPREIEYNRGRWNMKIYLAICAVICVMNWLSLKVLSEKVKRNGYKKVRKRSISERLLGLMMLVLFSIIPILNVLYLFVNLLKSDEMYEKMIESEEMYIKVVED